MSEYDFVLACESVELVFRGFKVLACDSGYLFGNLNVKSLGSVKTGTYGSSAESKSFQCGKRAFYKFNVLFKR